MNVEILTVKKAFSYYQNLYSEVKRNYESFNGMDFFNLRLFKGDFLLLKNRFDSQVYALVNNHKPRILLTHYQAKSNDAGIAHSLGAILVANDITDIELEYFNLILKDILKNIKQKILFPLNAHLNLGFSIPAELTNPKSITFLTSAENKNVRRLIEKLTNKNEERLFHGMAYSLDKDPETLEKIKLSISTRPANYTVEKLSLFQYKDDIRDYNRIMNESFKTHFAFYPLSFEEEWDLMKTAILVINRNYFRFLSYKGQKIALSMFMPDYNTILENGSDAINFIKILTKKNSLKRVRGVNVAIIPEFQGKGLVKYVRNENLLKMFEDGVRIIESSYIDQDNINSLENVKSTGSLPSHSFNLYSFN